MGADGLAIDVGCGDGRYAVEIARRFGCSVLGVDPVMRQVERARALVDGSGLSGLVRIEQASIQALPAKQASVDCVWCRDMLVHVDARAGLAECARVLRSGGHMLVYHVFATEAMGEAEAGRIYRGLGIVPANMKESYFFSAAETAGLSVARKEVVGSSWREWRAEGGSTELQHDIVSLARLRRREAELVARYGRHFYEAAYALRHWGVYVMLGKLQPTMYDLTRG